MKKTSKIVALVLCLALVVTATVVVLTACSPSGHTYKGDCHYNSHNTEYGVKVDVSVDDEGKISAVKLYSDEESGYVRTSADNTEYGWDKHDETEDAYDNYLSENFVGKKVLDVFHYEATADASGQTVGEGTPKIAGATQSSARIISAVKDALKGIVFTGDCHYDATYGEHTTHYGAKVDVLVIDNKVLDFRLYTDEESGYVRTTTTWEAGEGTGIGHDAAEDAYPQWLKDTFVGKTVAEIKAYVATANADKQEVGEGTPKIAGASQSSARIIVAVKNALSKLA